MGSMEEVDLVNEEPGPDMMAMGGQAGVNPMMMMPGMNPQLAGQMMPNPMGFTNPVNDF